MQNFDIEDRMPRMHFARADRTGGKGDATNPEQLF
jgi:hypothetical protein